MANNVQTGLNDYRNVVEHYIECIFKSGILLNEHDELLNQFWRSPSYKKTKYGKIYLLSTTLLTGFIISIYKKSPVYGAISIIPLGIKLSHTLVMRQKYKLYKRQFSSFIDILQKIFVVNKKIMQHYQMRKVTVNNLGGYTRKRIENLISTRMLRFLSDVGENMLELILFLRNILNQIGSIIDIGELNFVFDIDLNEDNFKDNSSEESILNTYDKIQMAYIYISSTVLCGIGLSLCANEWKSKNNQFTSLFSSILPRCLKYAERIYKQIKQDFDSISNNLYENVSEKSPKNTDKLTLNIVNGLKEYLQISFNIVTIMQLDITSCSDNSVAKSHLEDLEKLFTQCNEVLRVLQYQVYKTPMVEGEYPKYIDDVEETIEIIIKHDDPAADFLDEEFNLSVHGSDFSGDSETGDLEYDQLLEYVKVQRLMIKELNDELKKRNFIKQNDVIPIPAKRSCNKYRDMQELRLPLELKSQEGEVEELNQSTSSPLPPVPPPGFLEDTSLSTPSLTSTTQTETASLDDFLAQIRAAATNRGVEETIFGDDIISSDESSDS